MINKLSQLLILISYLINLIIVKKNNHYLFTILSTMILPTLMIYIKKKNYSLTKDSQMQHLTLIMIQQVKMYIFSHGNLTLMRNLLLIMVLQIKTQIFIWQHMKMKMVYKLKFHISYIRILQYLVIKQLMRTYLQKLHQRQKKVY